MNKEPKQMMETAAQMSRRASIAAKASRRSTGLNSVQAMITSPVVPRHYGTGTSRRETMHSRRFQGMPAYMTLPKAAMTYGPSMIPDSAQSGKR